MFGHQRNFVHRMSQLRYPAEHTAVHRRPHGTKMQQRGLRGGYVGVPTHQPNYVQHQGYQRNGGSRMCQQNCGPTTPKPIFRRYRYEIPPRFRALIGVPRRDTLLPPQQHYHVNECSNKVDLYYQRPPLDNDKPTHPGFIPHAEVIRGIGSEDSLSLDGKPFAEDLLSELEQRPEYPRPKWDYPENPSWQPPNISSIPGDSSRTELIPANEATRPDHNRAPVRCDEAAWSMEFTLSLDPSSAEPLSTSDEKMRRLRVFRDLCEKFDRQQEWALAEPFYPRQTRATEQDTISTTCQQTLETWALAEPFYPKQPQPAEQFAADETEFRKLDDWAQAKPFYPWQQF